MEIKIFGSVKDVKGIINRLIKKYPNKSLSEVIKLEYDKENVVLT